MTSTGFVFAHIFFSVFLTPYDISYETATKDYREALVRGVSDETNEAWLSFLWTEGVDFSIQDGRDLYVTGNSLEVLRKAQEKSTLAEEANRAYTEREIERKASVEWPMVENAKVCIAPGDKSGKGTNDFILVVAKNLPVSEKEKMERLVRNEWGSGQSANVQIVGCVYPTERVSNGMDGRKGSISLAQR